MEEPELVPVFHSRLIRTQRRRVFHRDGSPAGWLITHTEPFAVADPAEPDDPPRTAIPRQR